MTHNEIINYRRNATIAEILHYAADKYLNHKEHYTKGKTRWSCIAILMSIFNTDDCWLYDVEEWEKNKQFKEIMCGLKNMGFRTINSEGAIFRGIRDLEKQQARYGWLKFCAMLAEEQGV